MSDSDGENFVKYGNALEPLDEENIPRKKPITIEDQFACDEFGRRRFHGAFTGGFSAGYFNSVGSRDGWRPQQFKSTRSKKAENVAQRPEDFMDEEDTAEFGIAPTAIRATSDYTNQSKGKKRERPSVSTGPIPGVPVLKELLQPVRERVGVRLLKQMGWKPGQGVGPRITKKEKKHIKQRNAKIKIYGCSLPTDQEQIHDSDSDSSDNEYSNITFAPDDYEPFRLNPKDNYFGIGYTGLDRRPILSEHINLFDTTEFNMESKNKKLSVRGQAFGVGAFEADDEDIYAKDDMSRYDFAIGQEVKKVKKKSRWSKEDKFKTKENVIEGFVVAKINLESKKIFEVPILPKNFKPVHKVRKSRFEPPIEVPVPTCYVDKKKPPLNAESRAKIINDETPAIISTTSSNQSANSVASNIIARTLNLYGREATEERAKQEKQRTASWLDKLHGTQFVKGETLGTKLSVDNNLTDLGSTKNSPLSAPPIKPSFADPGKQKRFEQYLAFHKNDRKLKLASIQPLSMTEWDREHEVTDFEQAARLCEQQEGIQEESVESQEKEPEIPFENLNRDEQMKKAVKMKMFGPLTRDVQVWQPTSLLCKGFNVPEPDCGCAKPAAKKTFSIFESLESSNFKFEHGEESHLRETAPGLNQPVSTSSNNLEKDSDKSLIDNLTSLSEKEKIFEASYEKVFGKNAQEQIDEESDSENADNSKTVEEKKDLFKAIFLSSSEDSDSEDETKTDEIDEEKVKAVLIGKSAIESNVLRNTSPPRGIFAMLDHDNLIKPPDKLKFKLDANVNVASEQEITSPPESEVNTITIVEDELPIDMYGPALPKQLPNQTSSETATSITQKMLFQPVGSKLNIEGKWVEKTKKDKKMKKEKKKHKHRKRFRSKSRSRKKSKKDKR